MSVASALISAGSATNVLLIGSETMSLSLDVTSRSTAFLFGDGAGAVVIGPAEENGISPTVWGDARTPRPSGRPSTSPTSSTRSQGQTGDVLTMEGPRVFRWRRSPCPRRCQAHSMSRACTPTTSRCSSHQANGRINELMKKNCAARRRPGRQRHRVFTGNTSAASIPLAMEEMLATGKAEGGQTALMLGFGAGLSYAAQVVTLPPAPKITSFDDQ